METQEAWGHAPKLETAGSAKMALKGAEEPSVRGRKPAAPKVQRREGLKASQRSHCRR